MSMLETFLICLIPYSIEIAVVWFFVRTSNKSNCKFNNIYKNEKK